MPRQRACSIFLWPFLPICSQRRNHGIHRHYPFSTGGTLSTTKTLGFVWHICCVASAVFCSIKTQQQVVYLCIHSPHTVLRCGYVYVTKSGRRSKEKPALAVGGRRVQHEKPPRRHVAQHSVLKPTLAPPPPRFACVAAPGASVLTRSKYALNGFIRVFCVRTALHVSLNTS